MRPRAGADLRWRAELRQRIESEPARQDSVPLRTGDRLAATVALLKTNSLFERCSAHELEQLAATAYPMSFDAGDLLCAEGDESPECYIIQDGQAVVTIGRKGVGTVGEHDVVGERGVLLDTVRSATVTAMTHMITYAISRERLRSLVDANPTTRDWMLEEVRRRYPTPGLSQSLARRFTTTMRRSRRRTTPRPHPAEPHGHTRTHDGCGSAGASPSRP